MLISIERLAEVLDEVRRRCPDLPVVAIPWMHAKHPMHRVQRELIEEECLSEADMKEADGGRETGDWRRAGALAGRFSLCLLYAAYLTVRLVQLRLRLRREIAALKRQRFHLIAKTWRIAVTGMGDGEDFYYGRLQERLGERSVRMLVLWGDPKGRSWRALARPEGSTGFPPELPELCLVPLSAPLQMAFQQLRASVRLSRIARMASDQLTRRVARRASRDSLSRHVLLIGLYYWIGRAAVRIWHPKAFVTLYEGHGWEQCAWRGAKAADSSCQTVGYQHTILPRHNLALLQPQAEGHVYSRPDVVLCLGPRTQAMLRPSHARSTLITFGTFRRSRESRACQKPCPQKRTVLVLPEAHLDEVELLFNSAMRVARLLSEYRFIFRCHPVLPFERVREHLEQNPVDLPNVELSVGRSIADDYARSSVILYRGSSSVLHAVLCGLKPVYLHDDLHDEIDPLFELNGWRVRACSIEDLEGLLRQFAATDANGAGEAWREAVDYVNTYTIPVDESSIDRFLSVVGLANIGTAAR